MVCPDDGSSLTEERAGLWSCRRCRGRLVSGETFSALHPLIGQVLRLEQDRASGAYARLRSCPGCGREMAPTKVGDQLAWLGRCEPCHLLWVERSNEAVMGRLERRRELAGALDALGPEARHTMAREIAGEVAAHGRQVRALRALARFLRSLGG